MNKKQELITGISNDEYKKWCKDHKLHFSKKTTKSDFLKKVYEGKIYKNNKGELVERGKDGV